MSHAFALTSVAHRPASLRAGWIATDVINGSIQTLRDDIKALGGIRGLTVPVAVSALYTRDHLQQAMVQLRQRGYTASFRKVGLVERLIRSLGGDNNVSCWEVSVDITKSPLLIAAVRG